MVHFFPSIPDSTKDFILKQPIFFVGTAPLTGKHVNCTPKGHPSRTFAVLSPTKVAYLDFSGSSSETISHIYENGRATLLFVSFVTAPLIVRLYCTGSVIERDDPRFRPMVDQMHAAGMKKHEPNAKIKSAVEDELERRERELAEREVNGGVLPGEGQAADEDDGIKKKRVFRPGDVDMRPSDGAGLVGVRAVIVLDVNECQRSCGFGVPLIMMGGDGKLREGDDRRVVQDKGVSESLKHQNQKLLTEGSDAESTTVDEIEVPPSPPATPTRLAEQASAARSQDVYDRTGIQFDENWDDRNRLEWELSKMVVTGQIEGYRRKMNMTSLDGLPGLRMVCVDWQERMLIEFEAWMRRTFVGQRATLLVGMLIALVARRLIVNLYGSLVG